jgi:BspA type Leucine rich repeat region (6 copies)
MKSKNTMKTTYPILLSLLLLAAPAAVQAQDAYSTNADGSIYTYGTNADGSANIAAYAGPPWVVTIPTNINSLTVTIIGEEAFENNTNLTSVTIPSSVTSIGGDAFGGSGITNVTIPNSVTSIGDEAFYHCANLTSVTLPKSVTSIGGYAFAVCTSLTNVTIPNSVTSIGDSVFENCTSLTSVTIPNSVTSIEGQAFYNCISLTSVIIPDSVTSIGDYAFYDCTLLTGVYFQGNSPSPTNDSSVFSGDGYPSSPDPARVYYLPGTTGWGAIFDAQPTAPWFLPNPQILTHSANFGLQPGGFGFTISWATNVSVVVEAATNLANPVWIPVSANTLTSGTNYFSDPQWTNYPNRFYRVRSP